MKKNFKRVLSAALVVVMLFTAFPAAFAFGSKETDYTIISPYEQVDWSTWKTYKANLHAHCDASDGEPTYLRTVRVDRLREVLAAGGCASVAGRAALARLDGQMLAHNASPGGAADLLAATLFLDRVAG